MKKIFVVFLIMFAWNVGFGQAEKPNQTFSISDEHFLMNNKPYVVRCGEMHFARIPREYWSHRLKMAKAMGLNTVCAYLFWNMHEPQPDQFNWSGMADAAAFCSLAQKEGLYVILRPGPYSCAEWEFGGFPWWLLNKKDIKLRTQDPYYLERSRNYLKEVGRVLAPLQISNGGNIIMTQIENEYGSYGNDKAYIGKLRDYLKEAGFNLPLFTCDGPSQLKNDVRDDIFSVVNFGGNPEESFKYLRDIRPKGPLMCGEYYPGWFDSWGSKHHTGSVQNVVKELKYMLDHKQSFSIYMVHGGTSFGWSSGANCPPFSPQTSSYDYDAPISEAGWDTEKFYAVRNLFAQYLQDGESLPDVPSRMNVISISKFRTTEIAPLFLNLPEAKNDKYVRNMEAYGQAYGAILYRTTLVKNAATTLRLKEVNDYAQVYLNGKRLAVLDRRKGQNSCKLPATKTGDVLDILVEAMGRVNYGGYLHDRKGITENVHIEFANGNIKELENWKVYNLDVNNDGIGSYLNFKKGYTTQPAYHKGVFYVNELGDTFLDVSQWGKGMVWINGHNLGRYWNIGPTQTMYIPGVWLKKGVNEVVVLDYIGGKSNILQALKNPILDSVTEKSTVKRHRKEGQVLELSTAKPIIQGSLNAGTEWQTVRFENTVNMRYFCIEALNAHNGTPFTTIAELYLLDEKGKEIARDKWKVLYADSEEIESDDGKADNVFDLQSTSFWHTEWQNATPKHPHQLVIDLGTVQKVSGFKILPSQDSPNGRIKDYKVFGSLQLFKGL